MKQCWLGSADGFLFSNKASDETNSNQIEPNSKVSACSTLWANHLFSRKFLIAQIAQIAQDAGCLELAFQALGLPQRACDEVPEEANEEAKEVPDADAETSPEAEMVTLADENRIDIRWNSQKLIMWKLEISCVRFCELWIDMILLVVSCATVWTTEQLLPCIYTYIYI